MPYVYSLEKRTSPALTEIATLLLVLCAVGLNYDELCDLAWRWRAADKMWHFAQSVENLLDVAEHRAASVCYDIVREYRFTLSKAKAVLVNHTRDLPPALYTNGDSNWAHVLRPLHDQPHQIG